MEKLEENLKIACLQFKPHFGDIETNLARSIAMIDKAADAGAKVIVLPELANSGYVFRSRAEAFSLSEPIPDGPSTCAWVEAAARRQIYLIAGIVEREGDRLYNSAVVISPSGVMGSYRKLHLWGEENLWFEPGNLGVPVFATPFGRLSVVICYDGWFPEVFRLAAIQGADLVCVPTNWVPIPGQAAGQKPMANILHMAAAHSNSMVIACADRVGDERGASFIGHSVILSHTGWPVAGPASFDKEEIILAEVDLSAARKDRNWNNFNNPMRDRRIDVYAEYLGSK